MIARLALTILANRQIMPTTIRAVRDEEDADGGRAWP